MARKGKNAVKEDSEPEVPVTEASVTELFSGILSDVQNLLGQHFDLVRTEIREEVDQAKSALVSTGIGVGLMAVGGLVSTEMAAHLIHKTTGLSLWASYGVVAGVLGGAGFGLLMRAKNQAAQVSLGLPPQTVATLKEDIAWLQGQNPMQPA